MNAFLGSSLLAASMFLGQTGEPAGGKIVMQPAPQPSSRPIFGWFSRDDRPVLSRLTSWFKRDQREMPKDGPFIPASKSGTTPPTMPPVTPPSDFPRKLPNPKTSQGKKSSDPIVVDKSMPEVRDVQQTILNQTVPPKNVKSPILPQLANKIGRDEKFEWITGQLENENGTFVMYYSTPETVDKYHGRIVLVPGQIDLTQFRKGDLVSVRGTLAQRQTIQGMVPIYRLTMASLIERAKGL